MGVSRTNHPFWGTTIYGNPRLATCFHFHGSRYPLQTPAPGLDSRSLQCQPLRKHGVPRSVTSEWVNIYGPIGRRGLDVEFLWCWGWLWHFLAFWRHRLVIFKPIIWWCWKLMLILEWVVLKCPETIFYQNGAINSMTPKGCQGASSRCIIVWVFFF